MSIQIKLILNQNQFEFSFEYAFFLPQSIDDKFLPILQVLGEVAEQVKTGLWVGDCFIYTNTVNRINYYVGGEIVTVSHLDRTMYLLGYVSKDNR